MLKFSFDLGTTSVGWAALELDGERLTNIIGAGVRIFDEPCDPKTRESNAAARRKARSLRRQIRRRKARLNILRQELLGYGWLKPGADIQRIDPYQARAEGLARLLRPEELSRVLLHIAKRRGFKSNRKDSADKERSKLHQEATAFEAEIKSAGCRTIGEYLWNLHQKQADKAESVRLRCRRTLRRMYDGEFRLLVSAQQSMGFSTLTPERVGKIKEILFYQRSFELPESRRATRIGRCSLLPDKPRCPRAHPKAIEFRVLKDIAHLRLEDRLTGELRPLSAEQIATACDLLSDKKKATFEQIKKALGLLETDRFTDEDGGKKELKGNTLVAACIQCVGKKDWNALKQHQQDSILSALAFEEDEANAIAKLQEAGLASYVATKLAQTPIPALEGYLNYSLEAIERMIPHLRTGLDEMNAKLTEFGRTQHEAPQVDLLPLPSDFRNPTVNRVIHQFRRVINAMIKRFGCPDQIVLELARELKQTKEQRIETLKLNSKRDAAREAIRKLLLDDHGLSIDRGDARILKYELWEEQRRVCPYTGQSISLRHILDDSGEVEIEHVLPYSRSLDDSRNNLVLCFADANRDKGDMTPFEKWGSDQARYEAILQRVRDLPWPKRRRFSPEAKADVDTFISRQMNDTRYASRAAREYAELFFSPEDRKGGQRVFVTKGVFLGLLRRQWNIPKDRNFHYHHAEDAILNGLTTPRLLKKLAEVKKGYRRNFHLPMPQPDLPEMIRRATARIVVSHMQRQRLSGPLHKATSYGPLKREFAHRVRLDAITPSQLESIRDPAIKALAYEHLRAKGVVPEDAAAVKSAVKNGVFNDLKMKSGVPVRKVRVSEAHSPSLGVEFKDKRTGIPYRFAPFGNNYALIAPKSQKELNKVHILSMFEASVRFRKNGVKALTDLCPAQGIILSKGDSVKIAGKYFHVVSISTTLSGGPDVKFRRHDFAGKGEATKGGDHLRRITSNKELLQEVRKSSTDILSQHVE